MSSKSEDRVKQIIVMRKNYSDKDGKSVGLRRGKEIAQGAHASMAFLSHRIREVGTLDLTESGGMTATIHLTEPEMLWLRGLFAKVTLQVEGEAELIEIYERAKHFGLKAYMIEDSGLTEFGGVKTKTAVGIGPDFASKIDPVCGHLKLY